MTRDDIIRMAREAGFDPHDMSADFTCNLRDIERFAALVAAHTRSNIDPSSFMSYQEGFVAGAAAEREACARVCDEMEEKAEDTECCKWPTPIDCAAAIRARGETK